MRVTNRVLRYPDGEKPSFQCPEHYDPAKRFLLGRLGERPLVAICMNPSAASGDYSDTTVNAIVKASLKLDFDGWCIANVYPQRGTDPSEIAEQPFDEGLAEENCNVIANFLKEYKITEVWGAWGNPQKKGDPLDLGKQLLLQRLKELGVEIFYFGGLSKSGNPYHPLYLKRIKAEISKPNRRYL